MRPTLHLLILNKMPVQHQLEIEEALLRTDERNWCLFNHGSCPAIVMGLSGQPQELLNLEKVKASPIPVIKRFSGGGTVVVDENTLFVTFIGSKSLLEEEGREKMYPEPIMRWTAKMYEELGAKIELKENDYVIANRKCAGNAQYIRKERWLHHTSFLWDFHPQRMDYLLLPKKAPHYRLKRDHLDFLTPLKDHLDSTQAFFENIQQALHERFYLIYVHEKEVASIIERPHRRATHLLKF